jgi:hypothetical protein
MKFSNTIQLSPKYCLSNLSILSIPEWWRLFQKCVVHTKFDIYVFIVHLIIHMQVCVQCLIKSRFYEKNSIFIFTQDPIQCSIVSQDFNKKKWALIKEMCLHTIKSCRYKPFNNNKNTSKFEEK